MRQRIKSVISWILAIVIALFLLVIMDHFIEYPDEKLNKENNLLQTEITDLKISLAQRDTEITSLKETIDKQLSDIRDLNNLNKSLKLNSDRWLDHKSKTSRGGERAIRFRVTAYDLSYESCEKHPTHPEYGITYSGKKAKEYYTIAAGPEIPIGTRVYIPYFYDWPNKGVFVVEDRGGKIKYRCIDIFKNDPEWVKKFGVKYLDGYILD